MSHASRPGHIRGRGLGRSFWSRLLPADATRYGGPPAAAAFLAAANLIGTGRSLVHVLAPDSGAGTIASMSTTGPDGRNAVSLLGQWGGAQLLEAAVIWVVLARYRGLIPLMLGVVTSEQALRIAIGSAKPLVTRHTPPGAASRVLLPVVAAVFIASLRTDRTRPPGEGEEPSDPRRTALAPAAH